VINRVCALGSVANGGHQPPAFVIDDAAGRSPQNRRSVRLPGHFERFELISRYSRWFHAAPTTKRNPIGLTI